MIYITYIDLNNSDMKEAANSGIKKKVDGQIQAFKKIFGRVYYTCWCGQMFYLMDNERIIDKELALTRKECCDVLCVWIDKYKIQRTYIRYAYTNSWFLKFLQAQKEKKIKSVLEVPTYPYDSDQTISERIKAEDSYYRTQLCQFVEMAATYSRDEIIFGIPCIPLVNGITIEDHPLCTKTTEQHKIVLLGVAGLAVWHGYERIIKGLHEYYQKGGEYDILFKIVGKGSEENRYRTLVEDCSLQSHVKFYGRLEGCSLDQQYGMSDVAIGSLGFYKVGMDEGSPIKGAEYCARGIPFIVGYDDLRFSGEEPFMLKVSNDAEPIDMNEVVHFFERITAQPGYHEVIRNYAINHLTWDSIMKPVIDYLY